jgi:hypothetical protein
MQRTRFAKIYPMEVETKTENIVTFGMHQGNYLYLMLSMCPYQRHSCFKIGHIKSIHDINHSPNLVICLAKIDGADVHKLRLFYNTNTRFAFGENYAISLDFYNSFMAFITKYLKLDSNAIWINQMYNIDSRGIERIRNTEFKLDVLPRLKTWASSFNLRKAECDEMYDTDNDSCISES